MKPNTRKISRRKTGEIFFASVKRIALLASIAAPAVLIPDSLLAQTLPAQTIPVAVRAHSGKKKAASKWGPTLEYLNRKIPGRRFRMIPYEKIDRQLADGKNKRYQFILTNPSAYVELKMKYGAKALVTLLNKRHNTAQSRFGTVIFTHAENLEIQSLRDLKGKVFCGVSPQGFGGWRVAWRELKLQGINPYRDFKRLYFSGRQPKTVFDVLHKKADAGSVRTDMLERLADAGKIDMRYFRILNQRSTQGFPFFHSTPLYPEWPFAAMKHADPELVIQVKKALLSIRPGDTAARRGRYLRWIEPLDYKPVQDLLKELQVGPYEIKENVQSGGLKRKIHLAAIFLLLLIGGAAFFLYTRSRAEKKSRNKPNGRA